jgi:ABC-type multidrug transport system ATPase subunit
VTQPAAATLPLSPPLAAPRQVAVRIEELSKRFPVPRGWSAAVRHPFRREWSVSLQGVSCDIYEREFFGLLGPNGAGKTTLFKVLSTLMLPDEGSASVLGYDVVRQDRQVRRVLTPVLTNERSLNWRLTARENLDLYAVLYGLKGRVMRERVDEVLATVELSDTGRKPAGKFSSGMRQRLMIARALLTRPKVLLLDEPTRSLDPISARSFRKFLREQISEQQGCTVILATHNADEALGLCDRVGVLHRGRLLSVGAPAELGRQLADDHYRLWTKDPAHPAIGSLLERGLITESVVRESEVPGWSEVQMAIPGGLDRAAQTLDILTCAGVSVARFEPVALSLADLIERTVERRGGAS